MISLLGKNIKFWREKRGFSKALLAKNANISRSVVTEIENGTKQTLNSNTINKISKALDINAELLFMEEYKEYSVSDIEETLKLILSSNELTFDGKELSEYERKLIEDTLCDTFEFILKHRAKLN